MANLAVILFCLSLGVLLQRLRRMPDNAPTSLNLYVIYVALPALVLSEISQLHPSAEALLPIVFAWILMGLTALGVWLLARVFHWSRPVTGVLMLTVPLGNTGFVGIPLLEAVAGPETIPYAILYDQFGTFLALNTYGVIVAANYSGTQSSVKSIVRAIVGFPPFIALCIALATLVFEYPAWLASALSRISTTLVPVVMVAVGLQWQMKLDRQYLMPLGVGLVFILFITPAIAYLLLWLLGLQGLVPRVIVLQAAMPAMISAGVLAMSHNLAPRLASALVGYSLLLSLLTVWLWHGVIE
jgi:predicted permease